MDANTIFSKPFLEFKGCGTILFDDGIQSSGNFVIQLLASGESIVELEFDKSNPNVSIPISKGTNFTIKGKTTDNFDVTLTSFYIISHDEKFPDWELKIKFKPKKVILDNQFENTKPTKELMIRSYLINVQQTFRIEVDTELGKLQLVHFERIEENEKLMRLYHLPLITSALEFTFGTDGTKSVDEIVNKALEIIRNFDLVLKFAQGTWINRVSLLIYEKEDGSENYRLKYLRLFPASIEPPNVGGLTNPAHSFVLIPSLWKGFSPQIFDEYGLNIALDWYVISWSSEASEINFLNATTCLELLMDRFHSVKNTEFLIDNEKFKQVREFTKKCLSQELQNLGIESQTRGAIYDNLGGVHRRSYVEKAQTLLDYWQITFEDTKVALRDIVDVRNEITHKGTYKDFAKLQKTFWALMMILTRLFLAMFNYEGQYFDIIHQKFIDFRSVRKGH